MRSRGEGIRLFLIRFCKLLRDFLIRPSFVSLFFCLEDKRDMRKWFEIFISQRYSFMYALFLVKKKTCVKNYISSIIFKEIPSLKRNENSILVSLSKMLISLSNESFVTRGYSIKRFRDIRISFALKIRMKNSRSQKRRRNAFESNGNRLPSWYIFFEKNNFNRISFIVETVLSKGNLFIALWPVNNKRWRH